MSEKLMKLKPGLEMELFKQCCEHIQKVRIVIMLDGFDEISPSYEETVIDLLQALRQTAVEQLWVTTRPHLREELEDKLQQLSYTLKPFSKDNQIEFFTKFWSLKNWVTEMDSKEKEENNKKLEKYAKELIKKLVLSISDKEREFTGIPLQTRMLAEAFEREVKIFCQSAESMSKLPSKLDLNGLFGKFIESKYDIYQEEKFQVRKSRVFATEQRERDLKIMRVDHQLLALKVLFNEETVALFQDNTECIFSAKELGRIGIVQVSDDGKPHFIHRTFAEYYVADCLVNSLTEGNNTSQQVQNFILNDIFLEEDCRVIRVFTNGLMSRSSISNDVLKQYGNGIHDLGEGGVLTLHRAAQEDNANIIGFLLDSVQTAAHTDTVNRLL
jgi:predicted NACHT family NTPase